MMRYQRCPTVESRYCWGLASCTTMPSSECITGAFYLWNSKVYKKNFGEYPLVQQPLWVENFIAIALDAVCVFYHCIWPYIYVYTCTPAEWHRFDLNTDTLYLPGTWQAPTHEEYWVLRLAPAPMANSWWLDNPTAAPLAWIMINHTGLKWGQSLLKIYWF